MTQTPHDRWLDTGALRMHYRDWGGIGQPLVLLHGLASTCHIWDLVAPNLSRDFSVVALDQRGHDETDKPDHGYDFATIVEDLSLFLAATDLERPIIVGHSWGGDVALEFAVAHPEAPLGLCFVDGGIIEISDRAEMTLERAKEEMAPPDFAGMTAGQLRERARSRRWFSEMTPELEQILFANFEVLPDDTIRARLSRANHMRIIEAFWDHRPSKLYERVSCPVLLMPARQEGSDSAAPNRFRREEAIATAGRLLPKSRSAWLEDSIHDVPLQRPELVAETIRNNIQQGFFAHAHRTAAD